MASGEVFIVEHGPGWQRVLGAVVTVGTVAVVMLGSTQPWTAGLAASLLFAVVVGATGAYTLIRSAIVLSFGAQAGLRASFRPIYTRRWTVDRRPWTRSGRCVVEHLPAMTGTGLRRLPGGAFALLFRSGPAVEIVPHTGRSVVVQTDRAVEVVRTIQSVLEGP